MNDLVASARVDGEVLYHGTNIYSPHVDPVEIRRRIGMVFQKPNPFPKTIYENVAWGARINGYKGNMDQLVEESLRQAGPVGRGEGQAGRKRLLALWRAAAATVHCPHHCRQARNYPHG